MKRILLRNSIKKKSTKGRPIKELYYRVTYHNSAFSVPLKKDDFIKDNTHVNYRAYFTKDKIS